MLTFIRIKHGADGGMGNIPQPWISRLFTAGLDVLLQCTVCPEFLHPARLRVIQIFFPSVMTLGLHDRAESFIAYSSPAAIYLLTKLAAVL